MGTGTGTAGGVVRSETWRNLTEGDVISKAVLAALCSSTWSAWPLLPSITIGRRSRMVCVREARVVVGVKAEVGVEAELGVETHVELEVEVEVEVGVGRALAARGVP
jgi:hypothetical protein